MRDNIGFRTHVLLVVAMASVIAVVTGSSLLLIRHRLLNQVTQDLSQDLDNSVTIFRNLQREQLSALQRENALLARLPTLKALMTSGDDLTIQDGASEFWRLSGTDMFVLVDSTYRIVAVYTKSGIADQALRDGVNILLNSPDKHYLVDGRLLYACAEQPLYFGSDQQGTLLGYVVSGVSLDRTVRQISQPTGVEAAFLSDGRVVAGTLQTSVRDNLVQQSSLHSKAASAPATVTLENARYLSANEDLSPVATSQLLLVLLKSFTPAERSISHIDRMVLVVGLLALLSGTALMMILSRFVTRPLEDLSKSVRAFGLGDVAQVPRHGTQEVRQLSAAFASMRSEIQKANQAVLESERLATIGRMASSVSHDLRHYLAAIYANAEFLASDRFSMKERAEIFADIRAAVSGTTEMIDSLLIFSRTGHSIRRQPELMATILERATALVRTHPDADGVRLVTHYGEPTETAVVVDGKQMERAVSNLILNACQSARTMGVEAHVEIALECTEREMIVNVIDNGPGVAKTIRDTLFEPFVSEGKQKGTGLGLTLSYCIAAEHGGEVVLLSSRPGETIFQLKVARDLPVQDHAIASEPEHDMQVIPDENLQK